MREGPRGRRQLRVIASQVVACWSEAAAFLPHPAGPEHVQEQEAPSATVWGVPLRCLAALVGGLVLAAAFEPVGFAWLMPPAIAVLVLSVRGLRPSRAWLPTLVFGIAFTFFEILVAVLQAYVFTLLTAVYLQLALAEEH